MLPKTPSNALPMVFGRYKQVIQVRLIPEGSKATKACRSLRDTTAKVERANSLSHSL